MNILRIVYEWPPPWDGLAAAPYEMTSSQATMGHKIDIFSGRWAKAGSIEELPNVKLHTFFREPVGGTLNLLISPIMFFYYLIWRRKNSPDIIHSHGHFGIWIYWYRKFLKKHFPHAKELKTPLVVHFHNTVKGRAESLEEKGVKVKLISKYLAWPLAEKSDRWAVACADAMIFVSTPIKDEAIKFYGADSAKCFVIETGVNVRLFSSIGSEEKFKTRQDLGLLENDKVILNHGAMVERKNVHLLVEALRFLPRIYKLLLVGPVSDNDYEEKLKETMNTYHLEDRVVRIGYTPYPQVPIAFQASDIFVLPSSWEGFPKVVVQSLACGVPVLASGFKAAQEIGGLFYLESSTPEAIAQKIQEIVEAKSQVDIGFIRTHYSWDNMARKVQGVYDKLVRSA